MVCPRYRSKRIPLTFSPSGRREVNFSTSFQDKVYRNSDNTSSFDAYWLTDLGFSYTLKSNVRLGVNINNLFNKEYCNQALGNQLIPSMPRNFMLSASYTL